MQVLANADAHLSAILFSSCKPSTQLLLFLTVNFEFYCFQKDGVSFCIRASCRSLENSFLQLRSLLLIVFLYCNFSVFIATNTGPLEVYHPRASDCESLLNFP